MKKIRMSYRKVLNKHIGGTVLSESTYQDSYTLRYVAQ